MRRTFSLIKQCTQRPFVYGMIHVPALPGAPLNRMTVPQILQIVRNEAQIYKNANIDGIIVENMWDLPYVKKEECSPEVVATMTMACETVNTVLGSTRDAMSLGIQILAGCNEEAMAVANATGFDMIRAEGFVFASVADEGWMEACAGPLLRYRRAIGADDIAVFTDVKKKHSSHSVTEDISLAGTAEAASFFLVDGVIVTGEATGKSASPEHVKEVKGAVDIPVLVGSGVTTQNVATYINADALIVGSFFKKGGNWQNELDATRVTEFMETVRLLKR